MTRYYSASNAGKSGVMMTDSKAKGPNPLSGVIQRNDHALGDIRQQTRRLNQLTAQLGSSLPARLQGQWQVAALSPEALVIAVNGSVWSTTLRAHQRALLEQAGERLGRVPAKLKIQIQLPRAQRPRRGGPKLSETSAQRLQQAAEGMEDPRLAAALARLAARGGSKGD